MNRHSLKIVKIVILMEKTMQKTSRFERNGGKTSYVSSHCVIVCPLLESTLHGDRDFLSSLVHHRVAAM